MRIEKIYGTQSTISTPTSNESSLNSKVWIEPRGSQKNKSSDSTVNSAIPWSNLIDGGAASQTHPTTKVSARSSHK